MASDQITLLLQEVEKELSDSDKKLLSEPCDFNIPKDISLIQNKFDFICNDLFDMKVNIEERIKIVEKTELIMNLLNYRTYEIRYDFATKIAGLKDEKAKIEERGIDKGSESQIAFKLIEIEKELTESQELFESQDKSVKEQILEAQTDYEKSVNVLDDSLELMKKNFANLLLLVEAEKAEILEGQMNRDEILQQAHLADLETTIEKFTEMQRENWKSKTYIENVSDLPDGRRLKITNTGLLETESGREISYQEVRELNLLDIINVLDFTTGKDKHSEKSSEENISTESKDDSTSSTVSKFSSEDVSYLKENLGTPLTLALAEITAIQPKDPIHYLGHWLFKYRYNQEIGEIQKIELDQLTDERERIAREKWKKFVEEEARAAVIDMIVRAEEEAWQNELIRIQNELEAEEEQEENLDDEARDKFGTYDAGLGV